MKARDEILSAIRSRLGRPGTSGMPPATSGAMQSNAGGPDASGPRNDDDNVTHFVERAKAAAAQVRVLGKIEEIPSAIADLLRSRNLPAIVHLPPDPLLEQICWNSAPGLSIIRESPTGDDVAIAVAPYAIAETGTLVYPASQTRPPSWHYRPGVEIALLDADDIHADLESVLDQISSRGALPSTVNLVTGPSRTGDIEQTLELGAHGPKELIILVAPSLRGESD